MSPQILEVANSRWLWVISISIVAVVLVQALLFLRLSFRVAGQLSYPLEKCREALKVGLISAIGPSIAIFIVMVGMMSVIGTPITWLRLSIIGSASTELTAATVGAQVAGTTLGAADYGLDALAVSFWTITINGTGWLLITALFTHKLEDIRRKAGGGDARWLAVLSGAAASGCFGYLTANTANSAIKAIQELTPGAWGPIWAMLGGTIGMVAANKLAEKMPFLKEYALGIAMLVGMFAAVVLA